MQDSGRRPTTTIDQLMDEIDGEVLSRRFAACRAIEAAVWAYGLRTCTTPVERAEWVCRYTSHLEQLGTVWRYANVQKDPLTSSERTSGGLFAPRQVSG